MFKYCLTVVFLVCAIATFAQSVSITGKVVDEKSQPLPGASVTIDGTTLGATTDVDGNYRINGVKPGTYTLTAQFVGYTALKKSVRYSLQRNL